MKPGRGEARELEEETIDDHVADGRRSRASEVRQKRRPMRTGAAKPIHKARAPPTLVKREICARPRRLLPSSSALLLLSFLTGDGSAIGQLAATRCFRSSSLPPCRGRGRGPHRLGPAYGALGSSLSYPAFGSCQLMSLRVQRCAATFPLLPPRSTLSLLV